MRQILVLVFSVCLLALGGCRREQARPMGGPPVVPVSVAKATEESVPTELRVVGTVEASAIVRVKSQIAGELVRTGFTEGQNVAKGDVLDDQVAQEGCLAGTGLSDDVNVLALVGDRYAKRLRLPPAVALSNHDVWLVVHGSKTSRHSCHREVPVF